uniref:TIR domain-containing protein n=1 Tax=Candidatus Kentrum sp. TC TaxID=2126339 RepID=A0A451AG17_9GAMM|nr:MAG: TIR domain-containing protein [Candidatus Kentron sp. TC]
MSISAVRGNEIREFEYLSPELPFPGYCGLVKFYGAGVSFRNIRTEELDMKPRLSERDDDSPNDFSYDVFISHASKDKEVVMNVIEEFRKVGIAYWIDHENITFGDPIVSKIEEGLQNSRFVLVCLSENLGQSNWCRAEYGPILYREFSGNTERKAIPLKIDNSSDTQIPLPSTIIR